MQRVVFVILSHCAAQCPSFVLYILTRRHLRQRTTLEHCIIISVTLILWCWVSTAFTVGWGHSLKFSFYLFPFPSFSSLPPPFSPSCFPFPPRPQSGIHQISVYVTVSYPATEVVTFRFCKWCTLYNYVLLLALTRWRHGYRDLLRPYDGMHACPD